MAKMNLDLYAKLTEQLNSGKKRMNMFNNTSNWAKITNEKQVFRFLPSPDGLPFKTVSRHYLGKNNSIWCPKENREYMPGLASYDCPICEFHWKVYKEAADYLKGRIIKDISDEEYTLDPKLKEAVEQLKVCRDIGAKQQVFVNAIIRGKEEEGVKIMNLTAPTFKKILNIMKETLEEENKDICDPEIGSDFKIFKDASSGKAFGEIEVLWVGSKPLSKNKDQAKAWLESVRSEPIAKEDFPTFSQLENALVKKFKVNDEEAEEMSTESRIEGKETPKDSNDDLNLEDLSRVIEGLE